MINATTASLLDEALRLAGLGYRVIPLRLGTKVPWQGSRGVHDATTDETAIERWWTSVPRSNIGLACGDGMFVLDVDKAAIDDDPERVAELELAFEGFPKAHTQSGGFHFFMRSPDGVDIANSAGKLGIGLDVRASGGYVVAPPSRGPKGGYQWLDRLNVTAKELPACPDWLANLLKNIKKPKKPTSGLGETVTTIDLGRPGDDYNRRADISELLISHGWKLDGVTADGNQHWTRPGKDSGTSATLKSIDGVDVLHVFTPNAAPLEADESYAPFTLYALFEHKGDFGAAASALAVCGFGELHDDFSDAALRRFIANSSLSKDDDGLDDPPEPFPHDTAFPPALAPMRDYFDAVAEAVQVPLEAAALLGVAIATTGALKKIEVDCGGWREPAPLWALALLPSGERKSALLAELTVPIAQWERDEAKRLAPEIARQQEGGLIAQKRLEYMRKKAVTSGDTSESLVFAEAIAAEQPIVAPRLRIVEATPEALAVSMEENGERALVATAEGDAIDVVLGRYSDRPNMGIFLSGHAGDSLNCLRIGRRSVSMTRPALSLALIVQPEAMFDAYESRAARGRGFLARFLGCAPVSKLGRRKIRPEPVTDELRDRAWLAPMRRMLDWPLSDPDHEPVIARFDAVGQRMFDRFREEMEPRLCPQTGDLGATDSARSWASKLPGALARMALAMECFASALEGRTRPPTIIYAATTRAALSWAPWLIDANRRAEAAAIACGETEPDESTGRMTPAMRELVAWIRKRGGTATVRDLTRAMRLYRGGGADAKAALDRLVAAGVGHMRYQTPGANGGRPSEVFTLGEDGAMTSQSGDKTPFLGDETTPPDTVSGGFGSVATPHVSETVFRESA